MKNLFKLSALFLIINGIIYGKITGVVTDQNSGKPLSNVEITIVKTNIGTTSNELGKFEIEYDYKMLELAFNHIAYESKYVTLDNIDTSLSITLKETLLQMEDVVVTSMRSGYLLRDVPVSTEVIGKKEIIASGAITIDELLNQRAGVSSTVNVDGGSIFNLLGLDSRYILILKDGQPITGRFNNRVDLSQISISRIEKVEITKGPGSALYGSDAMGGIINIITDNSKQNKIFNISARGTNFGSNIKQIKSEPINTILSSNITMPLKNYTFYSDLTFQNFSKGQNFEYISADLIKKINSNTEIRWSNKSKHSFFLNIQTFSQNDEGSTKSAFGDILFNNSTEIFRSQVSLQYDWKYSDFAKIEQTIRSSRYSREYLVRGIDDLIDKKDFTQEKDLEYEVMYTKNYPNFNLVYGMEFSQPVYFSDRIKEGKQTFKQNGVFIQTDIDIHNSFDLVTGARLDRFQDTVVVSPRLAVSYKKNNWKLRGAYGYGFRSPSFMESLIDWEHVQFGYTVIGNQNLKPEVSRGMTLGVEYTNNENFQTSLLLYQNRFNNLIEDYAIQPGELSYRNINIAKFSGFEWTSKLAIGSKISFSSTYNYVENVDGDNNKLPNTVPHSLGSRISIALLKNKILLSFNNKLVGTYFPQEFDPSLGDYTSSEKAIKGSSISDLVIQYRLNKTNKILLGINNVSNFTNDVYGPYIGRVAYIEIQKSITNKGT